MMERRPPAGARAYKIQHRFCPWDGYEFKRYDHACPKCETSRLDSTYAGGREETLRQLLLPPWQRILWKNQPYLDNHTDATFLEHLVKNANFVEYDFWRIVRDSVVVSQHVCMTVIFLAMFYLTSYRGVQLRWDPPPPNHSLSLSKYWCLNSSERGAAKVGPPPTRSIH